MGNILKRSNYRDIIELQESASDPIRCINVQKCDCVVPDPDYGKCLHWAIEERNFEYASS